LGEKKDDAKKRKEGARRLLIYLEDLYRKADISEASYKELRKFGLNILKE
jgi:hypothetical protein